MGQYRLALENTPAFKDIHLLEQRIIQYNVTMAEVGDGRDLAIFVRDSNNLVVGGIYGWTWGDWLEIKYLWVDESIRRSGYGTNLLLGAEKEALSRGCDKAILDTYSFQSPQFYMKRGYKVFAIVEGFPISSKRFFMKKNLSSNTK